MLLWTGICSLIFWGSGPREIWIGDEGQRKKGTNSKGERNAPQECKPLLYHAAMLYFVECHISCRNYFCRIAKFEDTSNHSGVYLAGGSRGPDPPELPSGIHVKRKNPMRIFFVQGVGWGLDSP